MCVAHFNERPEISAYGETPESALEELAFAWEGVKETLEAEGIPVPIAPSRKNFSGQFNVRVDKRLHRALSIEAAQVNLSLNALISQKLAKTTVF